MASERYNTWNPVLYFEVCHGAFSGTVLRNRTIAFTLIDRASKYDSIEWELDNGDGLLAAPEYLALGLTIRVRVGYLFSTTPWRYFVINRVKGPIGLRDKTNTRGALAVRKPGRGDGRLIYEGRNRNAPVPKNPKKKKFAKPTSDLIGMEMNSANTLHKPRKIVGTSTSDVIKEIARRNGFTGSYVLIEPTYDRVEGLTLPPGMTDHRYCEHMAAEFDYVYKIDANGFHFHSRDWGGAPRKYSVVDEFVYGAGPDILELGVDGDFRLPVPTKVSVHGVDHQTARRGQMAHVQSAGRGNRDEIISGGVRGLSGGGLGAVGRILAGAASAHGSRISQIKERIDALITDEDTITVPDVVSMANAKAKRHFIERHLRSFKIRLRVVGNPALFGGSYVRLKGSGSPLVDGSWYVWEARHVFSGETYVTDVTLKLPPKKMDGTIRRAQTLQEESAARGNKNEIISSGTRGDLSDPTKRIKRTAGYRKAVSVE